MNISLAQKARQNRIAALEYLRRTKQGAEAEGEVLNFFAHRARQKAKPVFFSVRGRMDDERIAA
ncbi:hypothetical protein [Ruegeria aquimaris]|uniref:Resolvase/invertase-type recombinase catalytic domain-containing protein n=1 Tax=Ruegeria aquimaris TaxID=2984333 RepID=A0ABT3AGK8_9RHOB|nr:hypothetical protein [Ruegeria sp. XHP0148]MCV2887422.1 hypothetical protein [Ruegeria sp. XHP0148]